MQGSGHTIYSRVSSEDVAPVWLLPGTRLVLARCRETFAFETTLAGRTYAPWLAELRAVGYQVHLVFVGLPSAEAAVSRVPFVLAEEVTTFRRTWCGIVTTPGSRSSFVSTEH